MSPVSRPKLDQFMDMQVKAQIDDVHAGIAEIGKAKGSRLRIRSPGHGCRIIIYTVSSPKIDQLMDMPVSIPIQHGKRRLPTALSEESSRARMVRPFEQSRGWI